VMPAGVTATVSYFPGKAAALLPCFKAHTVTYM
jgi:hypothetical protein